jgi:acyl dehydratase
MQRARAILECSFSQADFDRFAALSGDDNPIHTDPAFSATSRFGRTVAHGVLLCSVLRGLVEQLAPGGRMVEQEVMFPAPTYSDEPMRFTAELSGAGAGTTVRLEARRVNDGVVTCQGTCRVTP